MDRIKAVINKKVSHTHFFFMTLAIYIVAIFPIIRANVNYIDDTGRVLKGYAGWDNYSRYVSCFLSHIIHANSSYLPDISPVPQIIAVMILSLAALVVTVTIKGKGELSIWNVLACIPLGLSPYFLECLSYKFDSPYMALSILASVLPLLFYQKRWMWYSLSVVVCMLVMCMTYQAASGIFPMFVVLLTLIWYVRKEDLKKIGSFILCSAVFYGIGVGIFFLFIMKHVSTYVSNGLADLSGIIAHYKTYLNYVRTDFRKLCLIVIALVVLCFVCRMVFESQRNKVITLMLSVVVTGVMFLLSFGLYTVLEEPLFEPRSMFGVGVYITFVFLAAQGTEPKAFLVNVLAVILVWNFFTFSFTYGNALAVQKEWEDFRREEVISDLTDISEFYAKEDKTIKLVGSSEYAPALRNVMKQYGVLERLVPCMFQETWVWGRSRFANYYGWRSRAHVKWDEAMDTDDLSRYELVQESAYHRIYQQGNQFVVELK